MRRLFTSPKAAASANALASEPTSPQQPPAESATDSSSSPQPASQHSRNQTSSANNVSAPTSRKDDPQHPLFPRGLSYDSGYLHRPTIHFFSCLNNPAQEEFEWVGEVIADAVHNLQYASYSVSLTHSGYSLVEGLVPVVICIAKELTDDDAARIQDIFFGLEPRFIREIFLYRGSTTTSASSADDFRVPQLNPDCGYSIGPGDSTSNADPDCSSSLGIYIRLQDDEKKRTFITSVHHGLGKQVAPVNIGSQPRIPIHHPSQTDLQVRDEQLQKDLNEAENEDHPRRREIVVQSCLKSLDRHRSHNSAFGNVYASELEVVEFDGHLSWSDWCVIEVMNGKEGKNAVMGYFHTAQEHEWTPRDRDRIYIRGIGDIRQGATIRKGARATRDTKGKIEFAYAFVQFEESDVRTRE